MKSWKRDVHATLPHPPAATLIPPPSLTVHRTCRQMRIPFSNSPLSDDRCNELCPKTGHHYLTPPVFATFYPPTWLKNLSPAPPRLSAWQWLPFCPLWPGLLSCVADITNGRCLQKETKQTACVTFKFSCKSFVILLYKGSWEPNHFSYWDSQDYATWFTSIQWKMEGRRSEEILFPWNIYYIAAGKKSWLITQWQTQIWGVYTRFEMVIESVYLCYIITIFTLLCYLRNLVWYMSFDLSISEICASHHIKNSTWKKDCVQRRLNG